MNESERNILSFLDKELLTLSFSYLRPSDLVTLGLVSKSFRHFSLHDPYWKTYCETLTDVEIPSSYPTHKDYFRSFFLYDPTINTSYLEYDADHLGVYKPSSSPDCNQTIIGHGISKGKLFIEIYVHSKGTEIFHGVTCNLKILDEMGMGIVWHRDTYAYTDGRRFGMQLGGATIPAEKFKVGDRIGVHLNMNKRRVKFTKNKIQIGAKEGFVMKESKYYYVFVMLDYAEDYLTVCDVKWNKKLSAIISNKVDNNNDNYKKKFCGSYPCRDLKKINDIDDYLW